MANGIDSTFNIVASALLSLMAALGLALMRLFFHRRHLSPLKQRRPLLILATNTICLANPIACVAIFNVEGISCLGEMWMRSFLTPLLGTVVLYRVVELIFASSIAADRFNKLAPQASARQPDNSESDVNWFVKHSSLHGSWKLIAAATLHAACWYAALVALSVADRGLAEGFEPDCASVQGNLNMLNNVFVAWIAVLYMSLAVAFLRNTVAECVPTTLLFWFLSLIDGSCFDLKLEFKVMAVVVACGLALFGTLTQVLSVDTKTRYPINYFAGSCIPLSVIFTTSILPLQRSYTVWRQRSPRVGNRVHPIGGDGVSEHSLADVISTEAGVDLFRRFCVTAFAVESLSFLQETEDFVEQAAALRQRAASPTAAASDTAAKAALVAHALELHERFIIDGAPFQVNLPGSIVAQIDKQLAPFRTAPTSSAVLPLEAGLAAAEMSISQTPVPSARGSLSKNAPAVGREKSRPRIVLVAERCTTAAAPTTLAAPASAAAGAATASNSAASTARGHALDDVFTAARREIMRLLDTDVFPRFIRTPAFKAFVELEPVQVAAEPVK